MSIFASMLLRWLREDESPYERGYTAGYMNASRTQLEPWERCYLENIQNARLRGINA